jgi:serine/threonine protein kinase
MYISTGGKYVAEGLAGCVFRPAIRCLSDSEVIPNSISKITDKNTADKEENTNEIIRKIDPNGEYFITLYKRCAIGEISSKDGMNKCAVVNNKRYKPGYLRRTIKLGEVLPKFDNLVFMDGGKKSLKDVIDNMSVKEMAGVFLHLLRGVELLNNNGIIHGDLHLDNIMVDGKNVRIIDFGSVYRMDELLKMSGEEYYNKFVSRILRNSSGYFYNPEFAYAGTDGNIDRIRIIIRLIKRYYKPHRFGNMLYDLVQKYSGFYFDTEDDLASYGEKYMKSGGDRKSILMNMDVYFMAIMFRGVCEIRRLKDNEFYNILVRMTVSDINSRLMLVDAMREIDKFISINKMKGGRRTRKMRRRRGGDYVDEGGYGCVFRPALPCKNKSRTRKTISKILTKEDMEEEISMLKVVKKLDPDQKYFISYVEKCEPDSAKRSDELSECGHIREELSEMGEDVEQGDLVTEVPDTMGMIIFPDGGVDLITVIRNPDKYLRGLTIKKFLESLEPLFKGLVLLNSRGLSHFDIKMENILFDGRVCRFIDFGFLNKSKKYYQLSSKYWIYPPEVRHSGREVVRMYTKLFNKYGIELNDSITKIIGDTADMKGYEKMVGEKVDVWSLGLALLESLPSIFEYFRLDMNMYVWTLIKIMMWPNVFQRVSALGAYENYKKVMSKV